MRRHVQAGDLTQARFQQGRTTPQRESLGVARARVEPARLCQRRPSPAAPPGRLRHPEGCGDALPGRCPSRSGAAGHGEPPPRDLLRCPSRAGMSQRRRTPANSPKWPLRCPRPGSRFSRPARGCPLPVPGAPPLPVPLPAGLTCSMAARPPLRGSAAAPLPRWAPGGRSCRAGRGCRPGPRRSPSATTSGGARAAAAAAPPGFRRLRRCQRGGGDAPAAGPGPAAAWPGPPAWPGPGPGPGSPRRRRGAGSPRDGTGRD